MAVARESTFTSRSSRIVLGFTVALGLCAAVAAAPTAPAVKGRSPAAFKAEVSLVDETGMRPLARGPAIRVGRAYGAEDEDCTLVLKPSTDERGRVKYMRSVTCAN
jgi:hypothetical protein